MFLTATMSFVASSIPVLPSLGLACQASMQAGRGPSHREQHVDASRDYVVAEEENARCESRAAACDAAAPRPVRERAPVLRSRLSTCFSTVRGDRCSRAAICLLASPSATRRSTSASLAVIPAATQGLA